MSLVAGTRLGPYEISGPLGAGGMGEVYKARDARLGRDVAVKVLPAEFAADPDRLRRFEQEARSVAALNHPNLLALFDIGTHEGGPFIVTELLEGESLQQRLEGGAETVRGAVEIAVEIASGLAAAHEKGIVHRDIKPGNVFVVKEGHIKILDFGVAKLMTGRGAQWSEESRTVAGATEAGTAIGTVGYMAPEQLRGQAIDERADIFAFGCVLYEMLAGRPPFLRATRADTAAAVLHDTPPVLAVHGREVPASLTAIVNRCLEKDASDRFSSAHELVLALKAVAETLPSHRSPVQPALKSIVVLPFENLSPDPGNAYFADGLTEEIISDLAKVRALRVISRTSAMLFRGSKKDVPTIARELNVGYVLEGSVRRAGNSLRITAQLVEAATDAHLWAEKYAGTFEDVFDMQEKVSRSIVEALRVELTPQEHRRMAERPIPNLYAYECYLKAHREIWRFLAPSLDKAMEYLEQGLRALPDNPLLLAGMAYVHVQRVNMGVGQESDIREAQDLATRALALAPGLPQGHMVLGLIASWNRGMMKAAITHLEQVLTADPNDLDGLKWLGVFYAHVGKLAEAAAMGERVIAMDPMSPISYMPLTFAHWLSGRFEAALAVLAPASELDPNNIMASTRALLQIEMGRREEAFGFAEQVEKAEQLTIAHRFVLFWRYAAVGDREKAMSWMPPDALQTCRRDFQYSWWVACAFAMLGDAESALDWLKNAIDFGFLNYRYVDEIDPLLAPLRGDPRFQALMEWSRKQQAGLEAHR